MPGKPEDSAAERMPLDYHFNFNGPPVEDLKLRALDIRIQAVLKDFVEKVGVFSFSLSAGYAAADHRFHEGGAKATGEAETQERENTPFTPVDPLYTLDQLVLPKATINRLLDVAFFIESAKLVFYEWNLRSIEPRPSMAVNFRGPPGTGKTMAAHALASYLQRKILLCRLSDLESKFHGEGPKNLVELFTAASESGAVLFLDEAESLLSKRFAQPEQAAESAINSMRTELLMSLDSFQGIIIFASNLPHSYDPAIESRLWDVEFTLPDEEARRRIWQTHLPAELPVSGVSLDQLAAVDGVSGRDIKQAIISSALSTARGRLRAVPHELLEENIRAHARLAPGEFLPAGNHGLDEPVQD
jgi:hypothetical protein